MAGCYPRFVLGLRLSPVGTCAEWSEEVLLRRVSCISLGFLPQEASPGARILRARPADGLGRLGPLAGQHQGCSEAGLLLEPWALEQKKDRRNGTGKWGNVALGTARLCSLPELDHHAPTDPRVAHRHCREGSKNSNTLNLSKMS